MIKNPIIDAFKNVYCQSKNSRFSDDFFGKNEKEIQQIASFSKTNKIQSAILTILFNECIKNRYCDAHSVLSHAGFESIEMIAFVDEFEDLVQKRIIYKSQNRGRFNDDFFSNTFYINPKIIKAINDKKKFIAIDKQKFTNNIDLLESISQMNSEKGFGQEQISDISDEFELMLSENSNLSLIKRMKCFKLSPAQMYVYFMLIWETLNGDESSVISDTINNYYKEKKERVKFIQSINKNRNPLVQKKLIQYSEEPFFKSLQIRLTSKSLDLLRSEGIQVSTEKAARHPNIINYTSITPKKLLYNDSELKDIQQIKRTIHISHFAKTIKKLQSNGLNRGFNILLYGPAGTGKTELVKQLALQTRRNIYYVDISSIKNKYYGESEKAIKKVFNDYSDICRNVDVLPILFIDEADAIISKRKSNSSNLTQTENSIQNILLSELDSFNGILIATTNLAQNFDDAFERRFLFKINIKKPSFEIRKKLWKNKLEDINNNECAKLAAFSLTGGQIDNVVRKRIINKALCNNSSFSQLIESCQIEESSFSEKNRSKIGF